MLLKRLSLTNFRIFRRLDMMELPRRLVLLVGDNAQGKTSLLEAIYYLSIFTSLQTSSDRQLINFLALEDQQAVGRIVAEFARGKQEHKIEVRLILESNGISRNFRKEIHVDGVRRTTQEALGLFNAVMFLPQMTRIIEDGPEERRRYLNLLIAQAVPEYARALSDYKQAVTQRNALLKLLAERGGGRDQLVYWDELVSTNGALIIYHRLQAVQRLEYLAKVIHNQLTDSKEVLRLVYLPSYAPAPAPEGQFSLPLDSLAQITSLGLNEIYEGLSKQLRALQDEEIARGQTTIGPHRDELRFASNRVDLGDFGSRGQIRTAVMSLKLAEVQWLKEKTGFNPVLLLDETLAELDLNRRADLMSYLEECGQAILTTTDADLFDPGIKSLAEMWKVEGGRLSRL